MFLDIDDYPAISAFASILKRDLVALQAQARELATHFIEWPEDLHGGGWDVFALKWQGKCVYGAWSWLQHDMVRNAGYSRMAPGTVIVPHVGYTNEVLRLHLGLDCPVGDCAIQVGDEIRAWRDGEVLLFDDTVEHSAWNRTDRERVVLLVDLQK